MLRPRDRTISPVRSASILTCLDAPVAPDAFRPAYCGSERKIYYSRNLKRELLPTLAKVTSTPSLAEYERYFERPWIDTLQFGFDFPAEYMPDYGRELTRDVSMAALLLTLDLRPEEKEPLLVCLVNYGIDLFGIIRAGHPGWPAHGGHGNGRKLPILLAGLLLGDLQTQTPKARFSEDMQTMYGEGWTGAKALYAGHVGKDGLPGKAGWGAYEHLAAAGLVCHYRGRLQTLLHQHRLGGRSVGGPADRRRENLGPSRFFRLRRPMDDGR